MSLPPRRPKTHDDEVGLAFVKLPFEAADGRKVERGSSADDDGASFRDDTYPRRAARPGRYRSSMTWQLLLLSDAGNVERESYVIGNLSSAMLSQSTDSAFHPLLESPSSRLAHRDIELGDGPLSIRAVGSVGQRSSANILLNKRYAWRGYQTSGLPDPSSSDALTLVASDKETVVGTITVGFDGPQGLLCDELFLDKIDRIRGEGYEVCEFTKLAMDSVQRSKQTLASLFSVAHIVARRIRGADFLLVEVNPRHVGYYQKMLGFKMIAEERMNRRVNAPAVLLSLDLAWSQEKIVEFNGDSRLALGERSLYPYFHSQADEDRIVQTMRRHGH